MNNTVTITFTDRSITTDQPEGTTTTTTTTRSGNAPGSSKGLQINRFAKFDVFRAAISEIKHSKSWSHVKPDDQTMETNILYFTHDEPGFPFIDAFFVSVEEEHADIYFLQYTLSMSSRTYYSKDADNEKHHKIKEIIERCHQSFNKDLRVYYQYIGWSPLYVAVQESPIFTTACASYTYHHPGSSPLRASKAGFPSGASFFTIEVKENT